MASIRTAAEVTAREIEWLWEERIPKGMITVIAGKPNQGKGLMMAHLAAHVTKRGGNVLLDAAEDDHGRMVKPRLEAAGANLARVILPHNPIMLPEQMDELASLVLDNEIQLVIIDPFNAHLSAGVGRHSDSVRKVTTPLKKLAGQTGCAMVIVEHALKRISEKDDPLAGIGGASSGLPAAARMAFIFGTDPDDDEHKILGAAKWNVRDEPPAMEFEVDLSDVTIGTREVETPSLTKGQEIVFDARRLLATKSATSGKVGRRPDKRADAAEWLVKYLTAAGGPVAAGLVVEDAKQKAIASKTLRRAADDMGIVRDPATGGKNCTWDLSDAVKQAMGLDGDGLTDGGETELLMVDDDLSGLEAQFDDDGEGV